MNAIVQKEIMDLMATESRQIEAGIDAVVESIQNNISVQYLPLELRGIMNMWVRTEWYHTDRVPKFEHCLRTIVARESKQRVFDQLVKEVLDGGGQMVDEDDLRWVVDRVSNALASGHWQSMDTDLVAEAKQWVSTHGEHTTMGDEGHFQWYDNIKEVVCYHLPHIPEPVEQNEEEVLLSLETLPCDFQHAEGWDCSICLEVDAEDPSCVKTACAHIFHRGCLEKCKRAYFDCEENYYKTCVPCPLCRADVN